MNCKRSSRELALDLLFSALYGRMIIRRKSFTNSDLDRLVIAMVAAIKAC